MNIKLHKQKYLFKSWTYGIKHAIYNEITDLANKHSLPDLHMSLAASWRYLNTILMVILGSCRYESVCKQRTGVISHSAEWLLESSLIATSKALSISMVLNFKHKHKRESDQIYKVFPPPQLLTFTTLGLEQANSQWSFSVCVRGVNLMFNQHKKYIVNTPFAFQ